MNHVIREVLKLKARNHI